MSKQIRGNAVNPDRVAFDFYPTDSRWTQALLEVVTLGDMVWECAAGQGDITEVLLNNHLGVFSSDIQGYKGQPPLDFLGVTSLAEVELDPGVAIVTNPPYSLLDDFITHSLSLTTGPVAMLANLQSIGGIGRTENVWKPTPPSDIVVIPERMKVNGKPSQFCHAWFVWLDRRPGVTTRLHWQNATN